MHVHLYDRVGSNTIFFFFLMCNKISHKMVVFSPPYFFDGDIVLQYMQNTRTYSYSKKVMRELNL